MHGECWWFLERETARFAERVIDVLEFGSRDVNGSPRNLPALNKVATYFGVDIAPGPGVDLVADAATVTRSDVGPLFDLVICAEVFEHTPRWPEIVHNAYTHLVQGGTFLCTAASDPRPPHSAVDGHNMAPDEHTMSLEPNDSREWYENVSPTALRVVLFDAGFRSVKVDTHPRGDVYAVAIK